MGFKSKTEIVKLNKELLEKKLETETEIYNNNWILENGYETKGFTAAIQHIKLVETVEEHEKDTVKNPFKWSIDIVINKYHSNEIFLIRNGIIMSVFSLCKKSRIDIALEIIKESLSIISEIDFATIANFTRHETRYVAMPFVITNNQINFANSKELEGSYNALGFGLIKEKLREDIFSFEIKDGKWIIYLKNNIQSPIHYMYDQFEKSINKVYKKFEFKGMIDVVYLNSDQDLPHVIDFPYLRILNEEIMDDIRSVLGGESHYF
jgi:hypothetical protein